jgi:large subunit ribosomal protein L6
MSRIGKNPIIIPEGVTVSIDESVITVKGKLGELSQEFSEVSFKIEDSIITVERSLKIKMSELNTDCIDL